MVISLLLALAATGPVPGPTIRDILEVTDISGLATSPDGRWIAYRTEQASAAANDYRILWYVAPVDGSSAPRRIGDGGGALYDWTGTLQSDQPVWSPASDAIYTRALIKGEVQVWRFPIHGAARQVTRDPSNVKDVTHVAGQPRADLPRRRQPAGA